MKFVAIESEPNALQGRRILEHALHVVKVGHQKESEEGQESILLDLLLFLRPKVHEDSIKQERAFKLCLIFINLLEHGSRGKYLAEWKEFYSDSALYFFILILYITLV